jgi:hypothetical protein
MLLLGLTALLEAKTRLITVVIEGQPPDVKAALWKRFLEETLWLHLLLARASDVIATELKLLPAPAAPAAPAPHA